MQAGLRASGNLLERIKFTAVLGVLDLTVHMRVSSDVKQFPHHGFCSCPVLLFRLPFTVHI